jgi:hypothetical protein
MVCGYVPQADLFYCPTVGGAIPAGVRFNSGHNDMPRTLKDWRVAGGTNADALLYGDWSSFNIFNVWANYGKFKSVQVDYFSRFNPKMHDGAHTIYYTRPGVAAYGGCPFFKTSKLLGGRATVTDAWEDWFSPATSPGFGFYAHKDGYNALYGDFHNEWYGDPQLQVMWWPSPGAACSSNNLSMTGFYRSGTGPTDDPYMSTLVWHLFDLKAGIDVGVPVQ